MVMSSSEKNADIALKVIIIEDSEDDTRLVLRELRKGGYKPDAVRVESGEELREALGRRQWDLVLADYSMPYFDGVSALKIVQESGQDVPFILVSGTITEETAVKALRAGAHDFVTKLNMARLVPAIGRELKEAEVRRERRRIEAELEAYHAGLEKRVEGRTAELKAANEKLRQSNELSNSLHRIGEVIHSSLDFDEIMALVVIEAAHGVGADAAGIGLLRAEGIVMRYVYNLPQGLAGSTLDRDKVRGVVHAIISRDAVAFNDAVNDERVNKSFWRKYDVRSLMAVPLISRNEIIGALSFYTIGRPMDFTGVYLDFARKLSIHVSLALENARLFKEAQHARERMVAARNETEQALSQLRTVVESMGEGVLVCDAAEKIVSFNSAVLSIFGAKDAPRGNFREYAGRVKLFGPEGRAVPFEEWPLSRALRGEVVRNEELLVHALQSGKLYSALYSASPVYDADGRLILAVLTVRDITERKRMEQELRESARKFRRFYDTIRDGVVMTELEGRIVECNKTYLDMLGYSAEEILRISYKQVTPAKWYASNERMLKQVVERGYAAEYEQEYVRKDGSVFPVSVKVSLIKNDNDQPAGFWGIVRDITERKRMEDEIRHMAHHDPLTGLPNRRLFTDILRVELAQARRHGSKLAVLFLDLDRFKDINDTLGHEAGDLLLKEVGLRFKKTIREADTVGRIGGDEFNIVMADIFRTEDIGDFAQKIIDSLRNPVTIKGTELNITTSIGISVYPDDGEEIDALRRYADIAMYHAKEGGRNKYEFYNPSINIRSIERMRMGSMLRKSIEAGELVIYFQPQVEIMTGRIICAEALVRWQHPDMGVIDPARFIPLAEETGFIMAIDEWVLRSVCKQATAWQDAGLHVCVTVNLSARLFENPELVGTVARILRETGMRPENLDLEITESMAMNNVERTAVRLRELSEMGIHISIDDFGTGYSSLNHLKKLPIERLKIDRSFVQDIATDADDRTIISAVTAMAHNMKLRVIAEGVETKEQLSFLKTTGCDQMQGFLFSKPVPAEEFEELVKAGK